ncbi:MAG: ABC transporter permease [Ktedonobacteraceae bacterium]|nr:ABC transporter permease [Ktedonobacteraceae bacterium]
MRKRPPASPLQESLRRLRRDARAMISLGVLVFLIVLALAGPPIYQSIGSPYKGDLGDTVTPKQYHGFSYQDLSHTDEGPSAMHWAGTDNLGRDMLARLMQGLLISLAVALAVEIIDVGLGVTIGVLAGYYGGWIDQFLARFTDLMFAFPGLLFVILLTGIFGSYADTAFSHIPIVGQNGNARLLLVAIALSITIWPLMARYVRGQTLQLKQQQFIEAARTVGTSDFQIIVRHIIPNLFSIVFIASTLNVANTIIGEAGISLLGLGVQPPGSSIGIMISDALEFTDAHPWEVLFPTIVLTIIVLAISFFGDGLRDAFDPRSKD